MYLLHHNVSVAVARALPSSRALAHRSERVGSCRKRAAHSLPFEMDRRETAGGAIVGLVFIERRERVILT